MDSQLKSKIPVIEVFKSLSLYLPMILMSSLLIFSILSGTLQKFSLYLVVVLLLIMVRLIVFKMSLFKSNSETSFDLPTECSMGLINTFIPNDVLFGTYLLSFTLFYFLTPMILLTIDSNEDSINYLIVLFFMCYVFLDLAMKKQMGCMKNITNIGIIGNLFSGTLLGSGISALLYTSSIRNLLYINDVNSNNEVCSMPSQQKFKCRVYKNGELVSSTIT